MLYEFSCDKCKGIHAVYYPISEAPSIGTKIDCKCGGKATRIFSLFHLKPEFFEYTLENASDKPIHFSTKTDVEKFRRDEFIKITQGTKLEGKEGKLEYADKYFKQDLKRKQKENQEKKQKALGDSFVKSEFKAREKKGVI